MRIATWNVASIKVRLPRVLQFLGEVRPDVLCLQETKTKADAFPHAAFAEAGYAAADHSGGQWAGVAVLGRTATPPTGIVTGLKGEVVPEECRWIEADVDGVRFASVYVPNGRETGTETFDQKLAFLDAMADRARTLRTAGTPLVVTGDCNVAPGDLDIWDPAAFATPGATHATPEERRRLAAILDAGLVDAYRHLHPDTVQYTWWDYRAGHFHKNLGLRIDLALVDVTLAQGLRSCGIVRDYRKGSKPSDHAPLVVDLDRAPPEPAEAAH